MSYTRPFPEFKHLQIVEFVKNDSRWTIRMKAWKDDGTTMMADVILSSSEGYNSISNAKVGYFLSRIEHQVQSIPSPYTPNSPPSQRPTTFFPQGLASWNEMIPRSLSTTYFFSDLEEYEKLTGLKVPDKAVDFYCGKGPLL